MALQYLPISDFFIEISPTRLHTAQKDGFVKREGEKWMLIPLDEKIHSEVMEKKWYHKGILREGVRPNLKFDNQLQLRYQKVFGDYRKDAKTYMSTYNEGVIANSYTQLNENSHPLFVRLTIHPKKLFEKRLIYHDPELLDPNPMIGDCLADYKNTFFVMGGIPKEAIEHIEFPNLDKNKREKYNVYIDKL